MKYSIINILAFSAVTLSLLGCAGGDSTQTLTDTAKLGDLAVECDETDVASRLITVINQARSQNQVCRGVQFQATNPVQWAPVLRESTNAHAEDMAGNNFFAHQGTNGGFVDDRVTLVGYDFLKVGENLAAGFETPEEAVDAWLASNDGHCENLMDPSFDEIGASCRANPESTFKTYWAMTMGKER